jgi:hypothetical protein
MISPKRLGLTLVFILFFIAVWLAAFFRVLFEITENRLMALAKLVFAATRNKTKATEEPTIWWKSLAE